MRAEKKWICAIAVLAIAAALLSAVLVRRNMGSGGEGTQRDGGSSELGGLSGTADGGTPENGMGLSGSGENGAGLSGGGGEGEPYGNGGAAGDPAGNGAGTAADGSRTGMTAGGTGTGTAAGGTGEAGTSGADGSGTEQAAVPPAGLTVSGSALRGNAVASGKVPGGTAGRSAEPYGGGTAGQSGGTGTDQLAGGGTGDLTYVISRLERQYEAEDRTAIFRVKISYPVFYGSQAGIPDINGFFEAWAQSRLEECETGEDSTRQTALEVYRGSRDSGWRSPWSENYEVRDVTAWDGYVSVLTDACLDGGGDSGIPYREAWVFRLSDGQQAGLSEITQRERAEWEPLLRARFGDLVREDGQGRFYADAAEKLAGYDMGKAGYYFTEAGIAFYLPPYEVAPYAAGYVETVIPYGEIAG